MTYYGQHNEQYITSREIGRGGEGCVFELASHGDLVLKVYNEPPADNRKRKLRHMVDMRSKDIEAYAAWPVDLVSDAGGTVVGFVMRKLQGYLPLHHVFSPMDRKKMFQDRGYNFLVHVARNVATAFHKLHDAGLVVGDVNEGNILMNKAGMVVFIDCDSFQVHAEGRYFLCEVGVPRYTPPELLKRATFENVIRTANTDNFSLAVLLFQLLFLGRHPFAGRHKGNADIDEETAIRQRQFAYSLTNSKKKLTPPPDTISISDLPEDVVKLFHQAFETETRPNAVEWIPALDALLKSMQTCTVSALHTFPAQMAECPWCWFRKHRGIMYFLDDSYLQANMVLGDIEQFVNGFRPEPITLKQLTPESVPAHLPPTPIPVRVVKAAKIRAYLSICLGIAGIALLTVSPYSILLAGFLVVYVLRWSVWANRIKAEVVSRNERFQSLQKKLQQVLKEYNAPADMVAYQHGLESLNKLTIQFRRLPEELDRKRKAMEEALYNEQLNDYLRRFEIEDHQIPSIGPAKKKALYNAGIRHAAHIANLPATKVPGIGPAMEQILMSWRRQMSADFVYIPDQLSLNAGMQKVNEEMAQLRLKLESAIRREYQHLNFLKANIRTRAELLEHQFLNVTAQMKQAQTDVQAIRKYAA